MSSGPPRRHPERPGPRRAAYPIGTMPAGLRLTDSTISSTGVVIGTYEPAGEIVTGSFE